MAKSFCSGCKHWVKCDLGQFFDESYFMFCDKFDTYELKKRKELCNGNHYENGNGN